MYSFLGIIFLIILFVCIVFIFQCNIFLGAKVRLYLEIGRNLYLKNPIYSIVVVDIQNIIIIFAHNISVVIMCNIKYYIKETEAYFAKTLGEDVALEPADKGLLEGLPISVSSNFSFYEGCLLRQSVLLAYIKDGDSVPPAQMKKLLDIIQRQTKLVVILITPCISSYNKVRLVAQKSTLSFLTSKCFCHLSCLILNQIER